MSTKWVTVKLGEILCAKFSVDEHVLITELRINNMPVVTKMPLVLPAGSQLTITASETP